MVWKDRTDETDMWQSNILACCVKPNFHVMTKLIEVDFCFISEKILSACIADSFINSNDQLADIFMKSLRSLRIKYICCKLGAHDLHSPAWGRVLNIRISFYRLVILLVIMVVDLILKILMEISCIYTDLYRWRTYQEKNLIKEFLSVALRLLNFWSFEVYVLQSTIDSSGHMHRYMFLLKITI